MTVGTEPNLTRERADRSTDIRNVLDAFAPEHDFMVPPRHAAHAPLAHDIHFVFDRAPLPLAPAPPARGRFWLVLAVLALLGTAAWGAYLYDPSRPLDLDTIAAWASRLATTRVTAPSGTALTAPATAPSDARANAPTLTDPLFAPTESTVESETARPTAARPKPTETPSSSVSAVPNVSGVWRLDTLMEASDSSVQSLNLHYEMTLKQDGDRVAGVGTKVSDSAQTPVTVTGNIVRERLTLNVVELGAQPETRRKMVVLIDAAGTLRGRFSSSAPPTSGHVEAHRLSSVK